MKFKIGDRVRVRVNSSSLWKGAWESRTGDAGTVTSAYPRWNSYGVLLDDDPAQMSAAYSKEELEPET